MAKASEVCEECGKKFKGVFAPPNDQRHFRQRELCNDCVLQKQREAVKVVASKLQSDKVSIVAAIIGALLAITVIPGLVVLNIPDQRQKKICTTAVRDQATSFNGGQFSYLDRFQVKNIRRYESTSSEMVVRGDVTLESGMRGSGIYVLEKAEFWCAFHLPDSKRPFHVSLRAKNTNRE